MSANSTTDFHFRGRMEVCCHNTTHCRRMLFLLRSVFIMARRLCQPAVFVSHFYDLSFTRLTVLRGDDTRDIDCDIAFRTHQYRTAC